MLPRVFSIQDILAKREEGPDFPLNLFDAPVALPPSLGAPYSGEPHILAGELSADWAGRPLRALIAQITGFPDEEARRLVVFGAAWLDRHVQLDPDHPLPGEGGFRLNYPPYGVNRFYECSEERVFYEDEDILVYDKESGVATQGVPHDNYNNVLAALTRLRGGEFRLAHRLDVGTSGLVLLAKSKRAASGLGLSFRKGQVEKRYLAVSVGEAPRWTQMTVEAPIAKIARRLVARANGPGLEAKTAFSFLAAANGRLLFLAQPKTGRTHQIRLHLCFLDYPVLGDERYDGESASRLYLRASGVALRHPVTGRELSLGGPFEAGENFKDF
ncbi:MAG: RluA family pseudouridine synthase [Deltaproteobacteria bacterium]|jgi:RluA family pseudouridine synthase|nr:RluA family pseudouridine synthase [Deltaproteobacteria bacterium]